ncbi:hypothetical protein WR32_20840 [Vibrio parahaemolyticus]|uniref:hypothetical protein n=1 Tax=Vibrio parahaemolyticus TaxID=670 RepID=UPI00061AB50F|nr:hypothetical protein [Vibrio parahaemolyticus]KKC68161.1 hypothetical protein WR32_20840 [Vibrio parahaemolyticus]
MLSFKIPPISPYVTLEEYSRVTGLLIGTIRQYISEGRIITKRKDKPRDKPLINMVAMHEIAAREALEFLEPKSSKAIGKAA